MSITSLTFAAFSLIVLLLYYLLPRRPQNFLLLAASYVFIATWAVEFALVFAALTALNFWLGIQTAPNKTRRRLALWAGIVVNVAALGYFKYANFFVPQALDQLEKVGIGTGGGGINVLLPIGLSFYVVAAISYLLDVYRGLLSPCRDGVDFALYMAYFPRVVSGPIERAREFLPKLAANRVVDQAALGRAFTLIMVGLVRKIGIADTLTVIMPSDLFDQPKVYSAPELAIWLLAYAFMIYNDFAGYTSIVRGVSLLFGIELSPNFNVPYFSRNFTEFWTRWHITLSNWLRDYIFSPLLRGLLRRNYSSRHLLVLVAPPLVTMLISAVWHDVSWHMLLWGGLHGMYQVVERLRSLWRPIRPPHTYPFWRQVASGLVVFVLSVLAWVPFRLERGAAFDYWRGLFTPASWVSPGEAFTLWGDLHWLVFFLIIVTLLIDVIQRSCQDEVVFVRWSPLAKAVAINLAVFGLILAIAAQGDAPPPFIYQGF